MFYYEEDMDRSLSKLIADTVRDLISQYNLTVQEVINFIIELLARYSLTPTELARIVASEFAISVTKTLIDLCGDQYNKHKR